MTSAHDSQVTLAAQSFADSKFDGSVDGHSDKIHDQVLYADKFVQLTNNELIVPYICLLQTKTILLEDVVDIQPALRARKGGNLPLTFLDVHWYGLGWTGIMWGMDIQRVKNWLFSYDETVNHIVVVRPTRGLRVGFTVVDPVAFWKAWDSIMVKL